METFDSGATRSSDVGKLDYEGFLSPLVLQRFAEYLDEHRTQADGQRRDSDNWQQGMPITRYFKSLLRHVFDAWRVHRYLYYGMSANLPAGLTTGQEVDKRLEDDLCAVIFNAQGYLLEHLKRRGYQ